MSKDIIRYWLIGDHFDYEDRPRLESYCMDHGYALKYHGAVKTREKCWSIDVFKEDVDDSFIDELKKLAEKYRVKFPMKETKSSRAVQAMAELKKDSNIKAINIQMELVRGMKSENNIWQDRPYIIDDLFDEKAQAKIEATWRYKFTDEDIKRHEESVDKLIKSYWQLNEYFNNQDGYKSLGVKKVENESTEKRASLFKVELGAYEDIGTKENNGHRIKRLKDVADYFAIHSDVMPLKFYDHKGCLHFKVKTPEDEEKLTRFIVKHGKKILLVFGEAFMQVDDVFFIGNEVFKNALESMREDGGFITYEKQF